MLVHTLQLKMQYFPDNFVRREINNLDISCRWSQNGCKWNGKLKNYTVSLLAGLVVIVL